MNKVYSDNTQLQYAYYDLPFVCPPTYTKHGGVRSGQGVPLNLGEVLRGDRIYTSDYELAMNQDKECSFLCTRTIDRSVVKRARQLIDENYVVEWIVDNLPGATSFVTVDRSNKYYAAGFKFGSIEMSSVTGKPRYLINNHVTLVIRWREAAGSAGEHGKKVIVGFEVYTKSIGSEDRNDKGCPRDTRAPASGFDLYIPPNNTRLMQKYQGSSYIPEEDDVDDGATLNIPFSYSVYFREDDRVEWSNRWDMYFKNQEGSSKIHWLAIANSVVIAIVLTGVVLMIVARTLHGDGKMQTSDGIKARRNVGSSGSRTPRIGEKSSSGLLDQLETEDFGAASDEELIEEISGWKLLHADVFRTPEYAGLLAPLVGCGCQIVFVATGLLTLSCLGVLNPSFRGGFGSVGMGLFVFAGLFSGYFSGRLYKTFNGKNWRRNTLMTAMLIPGLLFSTTFTLNLLVWAQGSSTALPFGTLVGLAALWLLIQVPLVFVGSFVGYYRSQAWEHPTRTSSIARQIPARLWYTKSIVPLLAAGFVPFAVIFIELLFIFRSIWQDKSGFYYVFGFLSVVSLVHILTVVEVTIVAMYIFLCSENWGWWWQSFLVGASPSVWVFLYCTWFYMTKLDLQGFTSGFLFFAYSMLACGMYGLLTGTVGFLTAYAFVKRIYR